MLISTVASAKAFGKTIYVVSKRGLQAADKYGKITSIYNNPGWMKEQRSRRKNTGKRKELG
jgi:hypothetical protein